MCKYFRNNVNVLMFHLTPIADQPVASDRGKGYSVGEADAACGEEVPRGAGA